MDKKKIDVKGSLKKKTSAGKNDKKTTKKAPTTRAGKIFRGPLFWIVVAILAVSIFGQITSAGNRYTEIGTSQAIDAISQSKVESAVLVDKSQKIRLILKPGNLIKGASKVEASYIARQEPTLVDALTGNPPSKGWSVEVAKQSLLVSFLFSFFPFLLIGLLFFFLMVLLNRTSEVGGHRIVLVSSTRVTVLELNLPGFLLVDLRIELGLLVSLFLFCCQRHIFWFSCDGALVHLFFVWS